MPTSGPSLLDHVTVPEYWAVMVSTTKMIGVAPATGGATPWISNCVIVTGASPFASAGDNGDRSARISAAKSQVITRVLISSPRSPFISRRSANTSTVGVRRV